VTGFGNKADQFVEFYGWK